MTIKRNIDRLRYLRHDHIEVLKNGKYAVMVGGEVVKTFPTLKEAKKYHSVLAEKLKENPQLTMLAIKEAKNGKLKKPKVKPIPRTIEKEYLKGVKAHFNKLKEVVKEKLIARLENMETFRDDKMKTDSTKTELEEIFMSTRDGFDEEFKTANIFESVRGAIDGVLGFSRDNFNSASRSTLGINLSDDSGLDDIIDLFGMTNASTIENVSDELLNEIEMSVIDGVRRGLRPKEIASKIMAKNKDFEGFAGKFSKAETRIKFIVRNEIEKLNANINEARQKKVGLDRFVWRTARDNRVRPNHHLEGQVFYWDKPKSEDGKSKPNKTLNPGEDYNCRCWAEPYFADLLE